MAVVYGSFFGERDVDAGVNCGEFEGYIRPCEFYSITLCLREG